MLSVSDTPVFLNMIQVLLQGFFEKYHAGQIGKEIFKLFYAWSMEQNSMQKQKNENRMEKAEHASLLFAYYRYGKKQKQNKRKSEKQRENIPLLFLVYMRKRGI